MARFNVNFDHWNMEIKKLLHDKARDMVKQETEKFLSEIRIKLETITAEFAIEVASVDRPDRLAREIIIVVKGGNDGR